MNRLPVLLLGAIALALPRPTLAEGPAGISVGVCGQPGVSIVIPLDGDSPSQPDHRPCCDGTACHVGCERSKRGQRGERS